MFLRDFCNFLVTQKDPPKIHSDLRKSNTICLVTEHILLLDASCRTIFQARIYIRKRMKKVSYLFLVFPLNLFSYSKCEKKVSAIILYRKKTSVSSQLPIVFAKCGYIFRYIEMILLKLCAFIEYKTNNSFEEVFLL